MKGGATKLKVTLKSCDLAGDLNKSVCDVRVTHLRVSWDRAVRAAANAGDPLELGTAKNHVALKLRDCGRAL